MAFKLKLTASIWWCSYVNYEYYEGLDKSFEFEVSDLNRALNSNECKSALFNAFSKDLPSEHLGWDSKLIPYSGVDLQGNRKGDDANEFGTEIWPAGEFLQIDGRSLIPEEEFENGTFDWKENFGIWNFNGQTIESIEFIAADNIDPRLAHLARYK
jgi:hypothetical protein